MFGHHNPNPSQIDVLHFFAVVCCYNIGQYVAATCVNKLDLTYTATCIIAQNNKYTCVVFFFLEYSYMFEIPSPG